MFRSVVEKPVDETSREHVPLGFGRERRNAEWNVSDASDRAQRRSGAPGGGPRRYLKAVRSVTSPRILMRWAGPGLRNCCACLRSRPRQDAAVRFLTSGLLPLMSLYNLHTALKTSFRTHFITQV